MPQNAGNRIWVVVNFKILQGNMPLESPLCSNCFCCQLLYSIEPLTWNPNDSPAPMNVTIIAVKGTAPKGVTFICSHSNNVVFTCVTCEEIRYLCENPLGISLVTILKMLMTIATLYIPQYKNIFLVLSKCTKNILSIVLEFVYWIILQYDSFIP